MMSDDPIFVLTHEYHDKSGFQVCGVTQNYTVVMAWIFGNSENHAYKLKMDSILPGGAVEVK